MSNPGRTQVPNLSQPRKCKFGEFSIYERRLVRVRGRWAVAIQADFEFSKTVEAAIKGSAGKYKAFQVEQLHKNGFILLFKPDNQDKDSSADLVHSFLLELVRRVDKIPTPTLRHQSRQPASQQGNSPYSTRAERTFAELR